MCDTLAAVQDGVVWFAKNSDREPGEGQVVEHRPRERHPNGARLRATYLERDQVGETHEVVLSRPSWMWGAEMGANEHGLAVGNEAVFTYVPAEDTGLLGMDFVRLVLERCKTADEALDLAAWLLARQGQGGAAGFRNRGFAPTLSYSGWNALELRIGAQVFAGPRLSQFGDQQATGFAVVEWFF